MKKLDWIEFWNDEHHIYVNERHKVAHDRLVTRDIAAYLPSRCAVLDFGCGRNSAIHVIAQKVSLLVLCDAAPSVRDDIQSRFSQCDRIRVLSPQDLDRIPAGSLDVIVMHSVAQYLSVADMKLMLIAFNRLLKDNGKLVIGDVISGSANTLSDAKELLYFASREGFLWMAVVGLLRTALSPYRKLRSTLGLTSYNRTEMRAILDGANFDCEKSERNIGHHQRRSTYVCVKYPGRPGRLLFR